MVIVVNALIVANSALTPLAVLAALAYIGWQFKRLVDYYIDRDVI